MKMVQQVLQQEICKGFNKMRIIFFLVPYTSQEMDPFNVSVVN